MLYPGSGDNIWFGTDQFHYAWKKLEGDFILSANIGFLGKGSHLHRKIGWMVRETLETNSPHVSGTVHGDGLSLAAIQENARGRNRRKKIRHISS